MNARVQIAEAEIERTMKPQRTLKWVVVSSRSFDRLVYLDARKRPSLGLQRKPQCYTRADADELVQQFNTQLAARGLEERVRPILDTQWWALEHAEAIQACHVSDFHGRTLH